MIIFYQVKLDCGISSMSQRVLAPLHFAPLFGTHIVGDRCFGRGSKEEPTGNKMLHEATSRVPQTEAGERQLPPRPMKRPPSRYSERRDQNIGPGRRCASVHDLY